MKYKLTFAPEVIRRRNQSPVGATEQLSFYVQPAFAAKINQLAQVSRRSVSSVLTEMVEFCVAQIEDGEAEFEQAPSAMHPLPVQPVAQRRSTKHLSDSEEVAAQTLRDRMGNVPDVSESAEAARKGNLRGMGYVVND